jgi:hypothetical protein
MRSQPEIHVRWTGTAPIDEVEEKLRSCGRVDVELPAEFHHAIHAHFQVGRADVNAEQLDEEGGAELLWRVAEVGQLHAIADLIPLVTERHGHVHIYSPAPHIVIRLS